MSLLSSSSAKRPWQSSREVGKIAPNQNGSKLRGRAKLDEESLAFDERSHLAYGLIADQISAPVLSAPTVLGQTEPAEPPNRTPDPTAPSDLVLLLGTNRMRPGGGFTRKHDRRGPNGQLPCILDRQRRLPRTLSDHVRSASALSALKKGLVANLSAKRQLSAAKLSAKRIFSLAKRDFLVANGRMAADFSSPESCTSTAQSRPAEIGALELHEVGRWCNVHRHCLLSTTGRGWYCFHDGKSFMKVRQPLLCSLLTPSFLFLFTPHAHYPFGVFLSRSGWLAHWSGIAPTLFWRMRGTLS